MTDPRMTGTKICTKCGKDLPVICFGVRRVNPDGLSHICRECSRETNLHSESYIKRREREVGERIEQRNYWTRKLYEDGKL